jgi:putative ABC transport system substrate-binding protein
VVKWGGGTSLLYLEAPPAAWPFQARAQQPGKVYRVGLVAAAARVTEISGPDPTVPSIRAFVHTLRDLGYVDGGNLVLERRSAEGQLNRFPDIFLELVSAKVDVIVAGSNVAVRTAKEATQTVPIVMLATNPVEEGLVESLARPGGNVTGLTAVTSTEIVTKRIQLLREMVPRISRVGHLHSEAERLRSGEEVLRTVSRDLGIDVIFAEHTPTNYADAFAFIARERLDGLHVAASASNYVNRQLIVELAAKNKLPAIYGDREYVVAGGLVAYGPDSADLYRKLAGYVDRILKGAKPADLPIERPTKFQLTINLKTAKALGLTIPPTLLARTDEVIE